MKKKLTGSGDSIIFNYISNPIEHGPHTGKGKPWAILSRHKRPLTNRQQRLLDSLPSCGSRVTIKKSAVSMRDLVALTAKTKDEFAMFTRGHRRLIVRGDDRRVYVDGDDLSARGYKWSGHTHPTRNLVPSDGDYGFLGCFAQWRSVIYNIEGDINKFGSSGIKVGRRLKDNSQCSMLNAQ